MLDPKNTSTLQVSKRAQYWRDVKAGPRSFSPSTYSPRWNIVRNISFIHSRVWTVALYSLQGVERKDCGEQKLQQLWLRLLPIFSLQGEDRLSWLIDIQDNDTSGAATNSQRRQTTTAGKQQKGTVIFQEQILFFISSSLIIANSRCLICRLQTTKRFTNIFLHPLQFFYRPLKDLAKLNITEHPPHPLHLHLFQMSPPLHFSRKSAGLASVRCLFHESESIECVHVLLAVKAFFQVPALSMDRIVMDLRRFFFWMRGPWSIRKQHFWRWQKRLRRSQYCFKSSAIHTYWRFFSKINSSSSCIYTEEAWWYICRLKGISNDDNDNWGSLLFGQLEGRVFTSS